MNCRRSCCLRVSMSGSLARSDATVLVTFLICVKNLSQHATAGSLQPDELIVSPAARAGSCGGRTSSALASASTRSSELSCRGERRCSASRRRRARRARACSAPAGRSPRAARRAGPGCAAGGSPGRPSIRSIAGRRKRCAVDERRDRVARQADERHAAEAAGQQRLARPHGDAVEVDGEPVALGGRAHQVEVADRGAADRHDQVGALGERQRRGEALGGVAGDRQPPRRAAGRLDQRLQRRRRSRRRSGRGPGPRRRPRARRRSGSAPPPGGGPRVTRAGVHRREEREVGRAQPARRGEPVAAAEVAAGRADARARRPARR